MNDPHYQYHVFFCTNQRDDGRKCCADAGAQQLRDYAKARVKELGLAGSSKGNVRINNAGCLDRCAKGPVVVVYPQGVWYKIETQADVEELIDTHLIKGGVVDRLLIDK